MAVADDLILINGAIYSNELWKFEWATQSYTILDSSNNTLKSAFSQYHIDTNSDNNTIYRIYMGEKEEGSPMAFVYEYNLL
jgi:hypothetical protein